MLLTSCRDSQPADWLVRSATPDDRLITLGPSGFETYARLRFIPDPTGPGQHEADVQLDDSHPSDLFQALRALSVLNAFTSTPEHWYFCVWDGHSTDGLPPAGHPSYVEVPHRRFALFEGAPGGWAERSEPFTFPPAFAWPADRATCFTCDVDPHWAGIGGPRGAIDALLADASLDVVVADPTQPQPTYY